MVSGHKHAQAGIGRPLYSESKGENTARSLLLFWGQVAKYHVGSSARKSHLQGRLIDGIPARRDE